MRLLSCLVMGVVISSLSGCDLIKGGDTDDVPPPMPVATAAPVVPTVLATVEPPKPGEIVRPELEDREDGVTGKALTVTGAKAKMQVPNDWTLAKTDMQMANAPDQRSRMAVASYATEGHNALIDRGAASSGLTGCIWQPPQSFSTGKDKLLVQAADGLCQRGGVSTNAAYMATEGLFVLGSWDDGADRTPLFGSMRSVTKVVVGTATPNLVACCRALAQNAKSQPPPQSGFMMQAASTCEAAARANNVSAVNSALSKFGMRCN